MAFNTTRVGIPLPTPPQTYTADYMGNLVQALSQNDGVVQKTDQDYILYGTENTDILKRQRLLLLSPNGTYFQVLVDDAGNLTTLNLGT